MKPSEVIRISLALTAAVGTFALIMPTNIRIADKLGKLSGVQALAHKGNLGLLLALPPAMLGGYALAGVQMSLTVAAGVGAYDLLEDLDLSALDRAPGF